MQFLSGLGDTFSQVKSHILLIKPLTDVKVVFSIVSYEESHKKKVLLHNLPQGLTILLLLVNLMTIKRSSLMVF